MEILWPSIDNLVWNANHCNILYWCNQAKGVWTIKSKKNHSFQFDCMLHFESFCWIHHYKLALVYRDIAVYSAVQNNKIQSKLNAIISDSFCLFAGHDILQWQSHSTNLIFHNTYWAVFSYVVRRVHSTIQTTRITITWFITMCCGQVNLARCVYAVHKQCKALLKNVSRNNFHHYRICH